MLGHIGAILGASWGIFGNIERFWGFDGAFLGPSWQILESFGSLFGPTWSYLGLFEASWAILGKRAFKRARAGYNRGWPFFLRHISGPILGPKICLFFVFVGVILPRMGHLRFGRPVSKTEIPFKGPMGTDWGCINTLGEEGGHPGTRQKSLGGS